MKRLLALALLGACHPAPAPVSPLAALVAAPAPLVLTGRVLAIYPDSLGTGTPIVLLDAAGRPSRLRVIRHTQGGMTMQGGNRVTAWSHVAGADTVADSVRVEP